MADAGIPAGHAAHAPSRGSALDVLRIFLRLGLTSFGGPVAHLGYFRREFVERRDWLDEHGFADIVALCQFLPGPASSQTGMAIGILRAGLPGGLAAWLGFTLPSALAMVVFGYAVTRLGDVSGAAWIHGLKIVAVAVVANAVWG
ncbi:MAG: chromate transporter, partial [Stellaceae bacterium]